MLAGKSQEPGLLKAGVIGFGAFGRHHAGKYAALPGVALAAIADPSPWRGLILSAPYFDVALPVPAAKVLAGKLASRVIPRFGLPSGLHGSDVTRDPVRARAYDEDPLVFKTVTARWYTESTEAQRRALAGASSVTLPLYVLMGTADPVAKLDVARAFFDAAGSADKTWDVAEGLKHEVLNEPEWRPIADRIGEWVVAHASVT